MQGKLLVAIFLLLSLSAKAQTSDRVEVFAGYSHLNYYVYPAYTGPWTELGYNGLEVSAAYHLVPHLAAEADFSFENGPGHSIQTYMGGARVSGGTKKASLFGHVLFGGLREPYTGAANTTFAAAFGGGFDYWIGRRVGVRFIQADYLRTSTNLGSYFAIHSNHANFRISTGVILRF